MKEKPIIFNTEMVKSILVQAYKQGLIEWQECMVCYAPKTETRRIVNKLNGFGPVTCFGISNTKGYDWHFRDKRMLWNDISNEKLINACPYGKPGDLLWVRESFAYLYDSEDHPEIGYNVKEYWDCGVAYKTDGEPEYFYDKWKPSIYMPKNAARIWLKVEDIKAERLQDITDEGALNEGISCQPGCDPEDDFPIIHFEVLWDRIHGEMAWEQNPWVWCVKFSVLSVNGKPENNQL